MVRPIPSENATPSTVILREGSSGSSVIVRVTSWIRPFGSVTPTQSAVYDMRVSLSGGGGGGRRNPLQVQIDSKEGNILHVVDGDTEGDRRAGRDVGLCQRVGRVAQQAPLPVYLQQEVKRAGGWDGEAGASGSGEAPCSDAGR